MWVGSTNLAPSPPWIFIVSLSVFSTFVMVCMRVERSLRSVTLNTPFPSVMISSVPIVDDRKGSLCIANKCYYFWNKNVESYLLHKQHLHFQITRPFPFFTTNAIASGSTCILKWPIENSWWATALPIDKRGLTYSSGEVKPNVFATDDHIYAK